MFSTLKITKHEMSNDTLWPPCGQSFSTTVETKMVTFITADCRTGSVANADVRKQTVNQHLLPFCGSLPGVPPREHPAVTGHTLALPAEEGDLSLCCLLLNTTPSQRNYSADDQQCPLFTAELWSGVHRRHKRQETTDKQPSNPDKWMENCNREQN